jgi:hypothetical protein
MRELSPSMLFGLLCIPHLPILPTATALRLIKAIFRLHLLLSLNMESQPTAKALQSESCSVCTPRTSCLLTQPRSRSHQCRYLATAPTVREYHGNSYSKSIPLCTWRLLTQFPGRQSKLHLHRRGNIPTRCGVHCIGKPSPP